MPMAEVKDFLCLSQLQRSPMRVVAGAVAYRDQQLGAHISRKVQNPHPLFTDQDIAITSGSLSSGHTLEVVIGFCGPRAGYTDPGRAKSFGKRPQPLVIQVNGGIMLHQLRHGGHIGERCDRRKFRCTGNLFSGVGLPEGSAGYLGHLNVIGHKPFVHMADQTVGMNSQMDAFF